MGRHCPLLEQLDISHSYVTDAGLLALCGLTVTNKDKEVCNFWSFEILCILLILNLSSDQG